MEERNENKAEWSKWYLLLIIPFIATLWPPFYAFDTPSFFGIPFFYTYQFVWVAISAILTGIVYFATCNK
jgi:hypothetical protein